MAAIISTTSGVLNNLLGTNPRHVKTPTIVCDNCGKRYFQTRCRPWRRNDAREEVLLCTGKKGCLTHATNGGKLICYNETKLTPRNMKSL